MKPTGGRVVLILRNSVGLGETVLASVGDEDREGFCISELDIVDVL